MPRDKISQSNGKILKALSVILVYFLAGFILSGCNLTAFSKPAALQITSVPDSSVFMDGKLLGKTPFYSDQLSPGDHTVKLSASLSSYSARISLTSGTLTVVNRELADNFLAQSGENLWLDPGLSGTFLVSRPEGTEITIDGKFYGNATKLIQNLEDGDHQVQLTKAGYVTRQFQIKTSSKYRLNADITLASEIARGQVAVAEPSPQVQVKKVEVLKTPQGFLRVRKDASLTSDEIGRVSTGDQLEVIQETDDWVKVLFGDNKQGWISKTYTKDIAQ